ncbi:hypothetical protein V6N12_042188 [Hibiscus sabdariffa]|uniref:Uncharacterized protein n=1 Tax=Hibiscus sabdariffa TaxID=183260 RepID=A0ABR2EGA7_9ROSI
MQDFDERIGESNGLTRGFRGDVFDERIGESNALIRGFQGEDVLKSTKEVYEHIIQRGKFHGAVWWLTILDGSDKFIRQQARQQFFVESFYRKGK